MLGEVARASSGGRSMSLVERSEWMERLGFRRQVQEKHTKINLINSLHLF